MSADSDAVNNGLRIVANLPEEVHWLCDRIELGPGGKEVQCEENEATRQQSTLHALMLLSFADQEVNQLWLKSRVKDQLARCSRCIEQFYVLKRVFYHQLLDEHDKENLDMFFSFLEDWDIERVKPVLAETVMELRAFRNVEQWYKMFQSNTAQRNAVHECFCSPEILRDAQLRADFTLICGTHKVVAEGPAKGLITFLFDNDEAIRYSAERSWGVLGSLLVPVIFESHLLEGLEESVQKAEMESSAQKLYWFWAGLTVITRHVSKEVIMKCICGAKNDPIKLAANRISVNAYYLPALLRLFEALMGKLAFEFWDVVQPLTSLGFTEALLADGKFADLLRSVPQDKSGEERLVDLTRWMSSLVSSIRPLFRPTSATPLLRQLFRDDKLPPLSRGVCLKEGMKVLGVTLSGVYSQSITVEGEADRMILQQANDLFDEHLHLIVDVAASSDQYEDPLMASHMRVAQTAALNALLSALKLDLKVVRTDFVMLSRKKPECPPRETAIRVSLWDAVCDKFPRNHVEYAIQVLFGVHEFIGLERIGSVSGKYEFIRSKDVFNQVIGTLEARLSRIFKSLSAFSPEKLKSVLAVEIPRIVIVTGLIFPAHGVAFAAEDTILQAYGVEERSEAFHVMFEENLALTLSTLTTIGRALAKTALFSLMPKMIGLSSTVLEVLCDRYNGVITKTDLEEWAKTALKIYWDVQWRWLSVIFRKCRKWAFIEDKEIMIEFTRDTMDYAGTLFDRFWTFEQALRADTSELDAARGPPRELSWGARLLQDTSRSLNNLAVILTIQDPHLLNTCQALMCKILKLLDQENVEAVDQAYFATMRKILYPEAAPGQESGLALTNLVETQKAELSIAVSKICPDFVPPEAKQKVIEIPDDEYGDIPDEDLLRAIEESSRKPVHRQTKLEFPATSSRPSDGFKSSKGMFAPKPATAPTKPSIFGELRVGTTKGARSGNEDKRIQEFLAKRKAEKAARDAAKAALVESKPKGTPTATTIVEDTSEEDSSEDEGGNHLFKLGATAQRSAKIVHDPKLAPGVSIKPPIQIRRPAGPIRRVKDNRARVAPDLTPLYKQILKWEFFHSDVFPPGLSAADYSSVASSFSSYEAYHRTFEPLLLLETWQAFLKSKEEPPPPTVEVNLVTRMRADNFVELETTISKMEERSRWSESDVVLVSVSKTPFTATDQPHCLARVHNIKRKFTGTASYEVQLRCDPPPSMMQIHMRNGATLHAVKIMGLVSLEREYGALMCLKYYDLEDEIINARPSPLEEPTEAQVKRTRGLYEVNEPQARAIISAVKNTGFTLIQGPPGTGKTKTVIGIVGALLTPIGGTTIQIPGAQPKPKAATKKILVCAPSNAAVDELVIRFKKGVRTTKGDHISPAIVRIGRSDAINSTVKDVTLEELIERRMAPTTDASQNKSVDLDALRQKHLALMDERAPKLKMLDESRAKQVEPPAGLQAEIDNLNSAIRDTRRNLDLKRDQKKESSRNAEVLRRRVQQDIMDEAQIICATLSGSGHEMLRNINVDFETVVIDEAAQSVELSALIPLKFGCEKCILVGDPKQLPPTVLSREAAKFSYEKSLFVRMQENHPKDVHLLSIQYRMHPMISAFPSKQFYDSELQDGDGMEELRTALWHKSSYFGPYRFFNVLGKESTGGRTSLVNFEEIKMALLLYQRLTSDFPEIDFDGKVGIITPYKQQLIHLKAEFRQKFGDRILDTIDFNTTDAFQGRERDIIIFSCVRASPEGGIGFLSDVRRMNVGLTRAKSSLFLLGNAKSLMRNRLWGSLVEDAKARNLFADSASTLPSGQSRSGGGKNRNGAAVPNNHKIVTGIQGNAAVDSKVDPDAMDIDPPEFHAQFQNAPQPPRWGPAVNPRVAQSSQAQPYPRFCRVCHKPGHIANACPNRQGQTVSIPIGNPQPPPSRGNRFPQNSHNPQIPIIKSAPTAQAPGSLKRPHEGEDTGAQPKRVQINQAEASGSRAPSGPARAPQIKRPQQPQKKAVQQRNPENSVFIRPKRGGKRHRRNGGGGGAAATAGGSGGGAGGTGTGTGTGGQLPNPNNNINTQGKRDNSTEAK